jgi:hypothetical protein
LLRNRAKRYMDVLGNHVIRMCFRSCHCRGEAVQESLCLGFFTEAANAGPIEPNRLGATCGWPERSAIAGLRGIPTIGF